jgi:hypothetical protein
MMNFFLTLFDFSLKVWIFPSVFLSLFLKALNRLFFAAYIEVPLFLKSVKPFPLPNFEVRDLFFFRFISLL